MGRVTHEELDSWLDQIVAFGAKSGFECDFARVEVHSAMSGLEARIEELEDKLAGRDEILSGIESLIENGTGL